jgi:hypothetical protein
MKSHFSSLDQYNVAELNVDESQIHGQGGPSSPFLSAPIQLDVSHGALKPREGLDILCLEAKLSFEHILLARSGLVPVHVVLQNGESLKNHYHYLQFTLDANRLAAIETRRAGGDVKFRFEATLSVSKLFALNEPPANQFGASVVWGFIRNYQLYLQNDLVIPRDVWISRVLPNTGYGAIHILEFPAAPIESCQALSHSFQALKQAEEKHKLGFFDDAAGKCRIALEPFFDYELVDPNHPKSQKVPVLRKSWESKLGKPTYDWLESTLGSIKGASNIPHHSPTAHFGQFDSQMILAVTTAVVAFIARTIKPEDFK